MLIKDAVSPGTPQFVIDSYATLAERAKTQSFGLIEEDVIVLDTETTGLSVQDNELIEISAARLSGREVVDRFDTFVHPKQLIPAEITELTSITNADVADAPSAVDAVAALADFVGGCPVIAHNATFDRSFIESVKGGVNVSDIWIDSLALSRIALPRLASHKLSFMADLFGCDSVSHRANADVDALCGVWRVLLVALTDLPQGLMTRLADMHPDVPWSYRPIFSFLAGQNPGSIFSLSAARADVLKADRADDRVDADELPVLKMPSREEIEADYAPGGLVNRMYPTYEPRDEQIAMALEVRDALVTGTHRVIEAGTGVGKSMAYLVPFAEAARRNNITVGIATKSNNLADQLMYHELPKLAEQLDGGLSFCALKGYDHYPCLRKLERMSRGQVEITTKRDPADTLTAVAVIMAYVCQSADGDLDSLGIRWRSVNRPDFTTASRECARRLCPFFPDKCLVHGARRRAAHADVVVTNHSLLFRNVAAEGRILPPIRHWVVDEAHSIEREARRQWARVVSADESRVLFERLGGSSTGALSQVSRDLATSEGSTLYLGLTAKATSTVARASMAIADVFDGVRELGRRARGGYDNANLWIGPELRESDDWHDFLQSAYTGIDWLPEVHTAIFASATMTVSKSFEHFNHAVGLDRIGASTSSSLHLDSSYDFDSNMAVVVAGDIPDPRDRESYLTALERVLVDAHLAMGGSVLTLFTNRRDMEDLYARVEPKMARAGLELNCQQRNSSPRRLRDRFINEPTSSLFALKAFWEGFDASGETLRCVIIPKLPFSSPTDPLSCERNLREDRAWARYSLPEAVLEVKQAAGRLIRSSTDSGVLILADPRLVTKGYGKKFLTSLPTSSYQRIESAQIGHYLQLWRARHERRR